MDQESRATVISNYYRASSALMEIGSMIKAPPELVQLAINATVATVKIIDYVNANKED